MKKLSKDLQTLAKSSYGKVAAGAGALALSAQSFAVDHTAAITAAQTDATTNTSAAVVAVIGVAAIVMGLGIVVSLIRR